METHSGKLPLNARIKVTYGKKNKVDFSYPAGNNFPVWKQFMIKSIHVVMSYYTIVFILMVVVFILTALYHLINSPDIFITSINTELVRASEERVAAPLDELTLYIYMAIFVILPILFSIKVWLNGKWFDKWFPKANAAGCRKFYIKIKELNSTTYEIPLFKNIELDYEATEEFGKYLKTIQIKEHPFKLLIKTSAGIKIKPQDKLWKAIFTFKKIPKKGYLEILFY